MELVELQNETSTTLQQRTQGLQTTPFKTEASDPAATEASSDTTRVTSAPDVSSNATPVTSTTDTAVTIEYA